MNKKITCLLDSVHKKQIHSEKKVVVASFKKDHLKVFKKLLKISSQLFHKKYSLNKSFWILEASFAKMTGKHCSCINFVHNVFVFGPIKLIAQLSISLYISICDLLQLFKQVTSFVTILSNCLQSIIVNLALCVAKKNSALM